MSPDGNLKRRSLREYRLDLRPTIHESGPFEERGDGYTYKSTQIYRPGDIVYVRANSSRHVENPDEAFAKGELKEVLREAVIIWGRLWKPSKYLKDPNHGKRIQGLVKRNGYVFKYRTGLNHPEIRENYWKIVTSDVHNWGDVKRKLSVYGKITGDESKNETKI